MYLYDQFNVLFLACIVLIFAGLLRIKMTVKVIENSLRRNEVYKSSSKLLELLRTKNKPKFIIHNIKTYTIMGFFVGILFYLSVVLLNDVQFLIMNQIISIAVFVIANFIYSLFYSLIIWKKFKDEV